MGSCEKKWKAKQFTKRGSHSLDLVKYKYPKKKNWELIKF